MNFGISEYRNFGIPGYRDNDAKKPKTKQKTNNKICLTFSHR